QQNVSNIITSQGGTAGMGAVVPLLAKRQEEQAISDLQFRSVTDEVDLSTVKLSGQEKQQAEQEEKYVRHVLAASFNDLGTSEARSKKFGDPLSHSQQGTNWDPDIPGMNRNLGVAAFKAANSPAAIPALSRQLEENARDTAARQMLGISYFNSNDFQN